MCFEHGSLGTHFFFLGHSMVIAAIPGFLFHEQNLPLLYISKLRIHSP